MTKSILQLRRHQGGQSIVEFAMASVLFFTVLFGVIQFGLAVWQYNTMSNLAQQGARWASVRGSASSMPATLDQLRAYVNSISLGIPVTVTATPSSPSTVTPGSPISVQVSSSFSPVTSLIPSATLNLASSATMVVSR